MNEKFAVRFNGLLNRGRGWFDSANDSHDAADLALVYKFTESTQLRLEGEMGNEQRKIYSTNYFDRPSFWDRTTSFNGTTPIANAGAAGVSTFGGSPYRVWIPGVPQADYSNWAPFYRTNGTGLALQTEPHANVPNSPVIPRREFNLGPTDSHATIRYSSITAWLDHRFNEDLEAQVSAYSFYDRREASNTELLNNYQIDVNRVLPNGLPNPKYGVAFAETNPSHQRQDRGVDEVRAAVTYHFNATWADLKQRFSVIGGARREKFKVRTHNLRQLSGPGPATPERISCGCVSTLMSR